MFAEDPMNLLDEIQRLLAILFLAGAPLQLKKIADGKGIGPKITLGALSRRRQTSFARELVHDSGRRCFMRGILHDRPSPKRYNRRHCLCGTIRQPK